MEITKNNTSLLIKAKCRILPQKYLNLISYEVFDYSDSNLSNIFHLVSKHKQNQNSKRTMPVYIWSKYLTELYTHICIVIRKNCHYKSFTFKNLLSFSILNTTKINYMHLLKYIYIYVKKLKLLIYCQLT